MTPGSKDIPIKTESEPYYSVHRTHARALSAIIYMPPVNDLEDCWLVGDTTVQMPKPLKSINESLVKQETDIISGNKPFTITVGVENLS